MSQRRLRNPAEALLSLRIAAFAVVVPLLMRLRLSSLERVLEPRGPKRSASPERVTALAERIDWVLRRGRPLVRPGCLTRGVTLYYFLRRAGADVTLVFGMGKPEDASFAAGHCWLVKDGEPFLEREGPATALPRDHQHPAPTGRRADLSPEIRRYDLHGLALGVSAEDAIADAVGGRLAQFPPAPAGHDDLVFEYRTVASVPAPGGGRPSTSRSSATCSTERTTTG